MEKHNYSRTEQKKIINVCLIGDDIALKIFTELGDLILHSLSELGYKVSINHNKFFSSENYLNIVLGGHNLDIKILETLPKNIVFINTEQIASLASSERSHYREWYKRICFYAQHYPVWDYTSKNIEFFKQKDILNVKYLRLGFQRELKNIIQKSNKDIDVLFYGSMNDRRRKILEEMLAKGLKVAYLFEFGKIRDEHIARAKIVLNLHYFDSEIFEIVRCFHLMSNGIAIVSEVNQNTIIDDCYRSGICGVPYEKLVDTCIELLKNEDKLDQLRHNALDTMLKLPQHKIMQELMKNVTL